MKSGVLYHDCLGSSYVHDQSADHDNTLHSMIDQAIFEAEKEVEEGLEPIPLEEARETLDRKYYGTGESVKAERHALQKERAQ